jgi:GH24 family phage-related lysozyme (muramidase)
MNEGLSLSAAGLDFIATQEGFCAAVYDDAAGVATIGYGHALRPGEDYPDGIGRDVALALLRRDAAEAEAAVRRLVTVALTQAEFDALVSFNFNEGAGHFGRSTLLSKLNAGDFAGAAAQFFAWDKIGVNGVATVSAGLARRRRAERALFRDGVYGAADAPLNA